MRTSLWLIRFGYVLLALGVFWRPVNDVLPIGFWSSLFGLDSSSTSGYVRVVPSEGGSDVAVAIALGALGLALVLLGQRLRKSREPSEQ